jgi:hypothetical protein
MASTRRTRITIDILRKISFKTASVESPWCRACGESAPMAAPEDAAALARVTVRTIYRWVEEEKVHFTDSHDGSISVCLSSCLARSQL